MLAKKVFDAQHNPTSSLSRKYAEYLVETHIDLFDLDDKTSFREFRNAVTELENSWEMWVEELQSFDAQGFSERQAADHKGQWARVPDDLGE